MGFADGWGVGYSRKESKAVKFCPKQLEEKSRRLLTSMMDGNTHGGLQGKSRVQSGTCQAWDAF